MLPMWTYAFNTSIYLLHFAVYGVSKPKSLYLTFMENWRFSFFKCLGKIREDMENKIQIRYS